MVGRAPVPEAPADAAVSFTFLNGGCAALPEGFESLSVGRFLVACSNGVTGRAALSVGIETLSSGPADAAVSLTF